MTSKSPSTHKKTAIAKKGSGSRKNNASKDLKHSSTKLYTLQVFIIDGPMPEEFRGKEISRTIQIRGNQTLEVLHQAIFEAFDREDEHLYEFQFGEGPHDPKGPRYQPGGSYDGENVEDARTCKLDDLELTVDRSFGYWFDFGDDWMHQIKVIKIEAATAKTRFPKIIDRIGKSPPQYPDFDEG